MVITTAAAAAATLATTATTTTTTATTSVCYKKTRNQINEELKEERSGAALCHGSRTKVIALLLCLVVFLLTVMQFAQNVRPLKIAGTKLKRLMAAKKLQHNLTFCERLESISVRDSHYGNPNPAVHAFVCNSGHMPLLLNSIASIQRQGQPWVPLVLGLDHEVCPFLTAANVTVACVPYAQRVLDQMQTDEPESYQEYLRVDAKTIIHQSASWGSPLHKILINAKLFALRDILHCHLDAFVSDTDIFFMNNPWPYFWNDPNPVVAQNDTNEGFSLNMNSGFMFWRNSELTRNLSQSLIRDMIWWHIDQARVNILLWERNISHTILPTWLFPNGHILSLLKDHQLNDTVAIHVNWNDHFDSKKKVLQNRNLWLLPD
jgi:hypothetical protein